MKKAFTLIELLIVVAIIAILAAIAVPNFLEAQTRSKVSRCKADIRTVATAIESYVVDNNRVPLCGHATWALSTQGGGEYLFSQGEEDRPFSLPVSLTTPIAYVSSIPKDPFGGTPAQGDLYGATYPQNYWYFTKRWFDAAGYGNNWRVSNSVRESDAKSVKAATDPVGTASWTIITKGPDKFWAKVNANEVDCPQMWAYDPTNGTVSTGNVFRCD